MILVEHFLSIQGEGKLVGTPSIFIRFGKCNLSCPGFGVNDGQNIGCDTTRAVYKNTSWKATNCKNLKQIISTYKTKNPNINHIILTGGEPLLNYQNEEFVNFITHLIQNKFHITIETNATIKIDFKKYPIYKNILFAMGVKLSNCGEKESQRINIEAINEIIQNSQESFFKFVIDKNIKKCEQEIQQILKQTHKTEIYCMPMGTTNEELNQNSNSVIKMCIQNNYNYSDRLHIRLWGNKEKT